MSKDLEYNVLNYILFNDYDFQNEINSEYFEITINKKFFENLLTCDFKLNKQTLELFLEKEKDVKTRTKFELLFRQIETYEKVSPDIFKKSLNKLKDKYHKSEFVKKLNTVINKYENNGDADELSNKLSELVSQNEFNKIKSNESEGDTRKDYLKLIETYEKNKTKKTNIKRQKLFFNAIDLMTNGGIADGDFWLVSAYITQGKSEMMKELAYRQLINGNNVFIGSGEMDKDEYESRLIVRHTHKFVDGGLSGNKIDTGTLDDKERKIKFKDKNLTEEECFKLTCHDWGKNKNYGRVYVVLMGKGETVLDFYRKIKLWEKIAINETGKGFAIIGCDSPQHLTPVKMRNEKRTELDDVLWDMKQLCLMTNYKIIGTWWASRQGYNDACKNGFYALGALSETSGAERNINLNMWLLQTPEMQEIDDEGNSIKRIKFGINKNRRGKKNIRGIMLYCDFETSIIDDLSFETDEEDKYE